ncbi:MAG: hypothetical protein RMK29_13440 [Myxococcales bacterium]|nr:hypothetical protein [Myxococcota bacterium]MDW8282711.1 hypothetical protein [Myxococcales bacterium]
MRAHAFILSGVLLLSASALAPAGRTGSAAVAGLVDPVQVRARFAPVDLTADLSTLPDSERRTLGKLIEAAQVIDAIFVRQVWAGNEALLLELLRDRSTLGQARLHAFVLNKGPWSELDEDAPFVPGVPPRPAGANFYPAGADKAEVERWMRSLPPLARREAAGFFTTIRRGPDGTLRAVPYSIEYQGELERAAALLREAAQLTQQPTLKNFLNKRAQAFLSNDYYESDVAWMELDSTIEPTIGPYEVYLDRWFNAKAAFQAYITLRDEAETTRLQRLSAHLQDIEDHLPIEPSLRNPKLGALAPIRVVNSIFSAGDGNCGVQTAAFNLPNDERTVRDKGSKRVLLRNVQEAKFRTVLLPIAQVALSKGEQGRVRFDAFFTHILMHELMHGLGPHTLQRGGQQTTVRAELQDSYSALEEAKADIAGLYAMQYLIDQGVLDRALERDMYLTFLASSFRTLRFGAQEAHGRGMAVQVNWLLDAGAFRVAPDGTFTVDPSRIRDAVRALTAEILTIQGRGDRQRAQDLLARLAGVRPEVQRVLDRLHGVPRDIEPRFPTAEQLLRQLRSDRRDHGVRQAASIGAGAP